MNTDVPRNALGDAYAEAYQVFHANPYSADMAETVNLLEIVSRRHPISITPSLHQELHNLFQTCAPALDKAEHLFNAALAGERILRHTYSEVRA